jgi:hypothetical protein
MLSIVNSDVEDAGLEDVEDVADVLEVEDVVGNWWWCLMASACSGL